MSPEIFQLIVKRLSIMYKNRLNELWLTENTTNLSGIVASFFLCTVHLSLQLVTPYLPLVYLLIELLLFLLEVGAVCLSLPTENKKKLVRKIFKDQDISVLITLNETGWYKGFKDSLFRTTSFYSYMSITPHQNWVQFASLSPRRTSHYGAFGTTHRRPTIRYLRLKYSTLFLLGSNQQLVLDS